MAELDKELTPEELEKIAGGYPDGDFPEGVNICPRCGGRNLKLEHEGQIESFASDLINSLVPDKVIKLYACEECACRFYRYGPFFEFMH